MKFEYQKRPGANGEARWIPMIPLLFRSPEGGTIGAYGLVDSGATLSLCDAQYAARLGIEDVEVGEREEFYGITGDSLVGYQHDTTMLVGNNPIKIAWLSARVFRKRGSV